MEVGICISESDRVDYGVRYLLTVHEVVHNLKEHSWYLVEADA